MAKGQSSGSLLCISIDPQGDPYGPCGMKSPVQDVSVFINICLTNVIYNWHKHFDIFWGEIFNDLLGLNEKKIYVDTWVDFCNGRKSTWNNENTRYPNANSRCPLWSTACFQLELNWLWKLPYIPPGDIQMAISHIAVR